MPPVRCTSPIAGQQIAGRGRGASPDRSGFLAFTGNQGRASTGRLRLGREADDLPAIGRSRHYLPIKPGGFLVYQFQIMTGYYAGGIAHFQGDGVFVLQVGEPVAAKAVAQFIVAGAFDAGLSPGQPV